jgi:arginine utilization protein RocB
VKSVDLQDSMRDIELEYKSAMIAILQDVHLDNPNIQRKIKEMFAGYCQMNSVPVIIVFCGPFLSKECLDRTYGLKGVHF